MFVFYPNKNQLLLGDKFVNHDVVDWNVNVLLVRMMMMIGHRMNEKQLMFVDDNSKQQQQQQ